MIWLTVLLCDRQEAHRSRFGLVLEAIVLSTMWPLVFLHLMISDDWDLWRIGRHIGDVGGGAGASRDTKAAKFRRPFVRRATEQKHPCPFTFRDL